MISFTLGILLSKRLSKRTILSYTLYCMYWVWVYLNYYKRMLVIEQRWYIERHWFSVHTIEMNRYRCCLVWDVFRILSSYIVALVRYICVCGIKPRTSYNNTLKISFIRSVFTLSSVSISMSSLPKFFPTSTGHNHKHEGYI